jgi:hypothetical protein
MKPLVLAIVFFALQSQWDPLEYFGIAGIVATLGRIWYFCLFPRHYWGELILTSHRLISNFSTRVPINDMDIGTTQKYYRLEDLESMSFNTRKAGLVPCCCHEDLSMTLGFRGMKGKISYSFNGSHNTRAKQMGSLLVRCHPKMSK